MELERTYNIPLRRRIIYVPDYRRVKKSVKVVKEFLIKHMKGTEVKLGKYLNNKLWSKGLRNPQHHIKVTAVKGEDNIVKAELFGKKYNEPTKDEMEKADEQREEKKQEKQAEKTKAAEEKKNEEHKEAKPAKEEKNKERTEPAPVKQASEKKEKPAPKKESEKSEKNKPKPAKSAEHKK